MEGTPSKASDDVSAERYGNGQVNKRPLPYTAVTCSVSDCDITRDTAVDSDNRQPATV
jgi:hypothetical protein